MPLHIVMQHEHTALFLHPQALQQRLLVRTHDVVIDAVADDRVEGLGRSR